MAIFKQHLPSFYEGFEKKSFEFNTFSELMNKQQPLLENHKWCYSDYGESQLLMVETIDNTKWFVIGYVEGFDLSEYLPKVIYKE